MQFDWDENKRQTNIRKHGIDFKDAVKIFSSHHMSYEDHRPIYDEQRFIAYCFWNSHLLVVVYTFVEDDIIRIITARKTKKYEEKRFL